MTDGGRGQAEFFRRAVDAFGPGDAFERDDGLERRDTHVGILGNLQNAGKAISRPGDHPGKASPIYYASIPGRRRASVRRGPKPSCPPLRGAHRALFHCTTAHVLTQPMKFLRGNGQTFASTRIPGHEVRQRLRELAQERPRFGSPRLHVLLCREGLVQNHKRTERLYRAEGLSLRLKRRKKRPRHLRVVMPTPNGADESWAMDFVADALVYGRHIRMLTIIDAWNRECPHIEVDFSLTGVRVARVLKQLRQRGRCPNPIRSASQGPDSPRRSRNTTNTKNHGANRYSETSAPHPLDNPCHPALRLIPPHPRETSSTITIHLTLHRVCATRECQQGVPLWLLRRNAPYPS
ncbi:IS3 family transposase [Burkholderia sp. HI2500]|uniref:IS3 family transposase n=1 Tax=Burkholderia sp. HI2500 TaxID=2015358 RepID=UPI000B79CD76|nr:hypothetical protein CFB45_32475 [Burkholderia sp. HI2500]